MNYTNDARDLISTRKETLVKNSQSLRGNPTLDRENRLPQGDEKFEPPSSSTGRKRQTRMVPDKPMAINKRMGQCDDDRVPPNGIDIKQGKSRKKLSK